MTAVVVEASVAAVVPAEARRHLVAVPARGFRARVGHGGRDTLASGALEVIGAAPDGTLLLVRPAESDAGAALLRQLAELLGVGVVRLPRAADAAAWVAAVAGSWAAAGHEGLLPRLQVLAAAAEVAAARGGGTAAPRWPVVRPAVLARWAARAWRPCRWCPGGGLPTRCGRCGALHARGAVAP